MAKVTMLKDAHGSADHISVKLYKQGETYDLPDALVKAFVEDMKVAEPVSRRSQPEQKMQTTALENKSDVPTEEVKSPIAAAAKKAAK